jgi:hypothetical protein
MNVVSFGGGTNSTAMIIGMYLHKIPIDLILFADTGGEQPHTYEFMGTFNEWLVKHGIPKIVSVEYHDKDGNRLTLEQECINSGRLPSIAYGYKKCSLKHKIGTQEKFCNNYQPCKEVWASGQRVHKYIGYDAGETRRAHRRSGQKVRKALSALRMGLDARGMCARDRAGRTAETGEKFMLFLPIHEEERNTSAVGELPRSL